MQSSLATQPPGPPGAPLADLLSRYLQSLLAGDRRAALRVVVEEGLERGFPVERLQTGVIQAAQREIGALWERNEISIAQEHMATAISHLVLSRLFEEAAPAPRLGRRVVVACVEGERHEFPARLVADYLDLGGFDVLYLGANVPTDHLVAMVRDTLPDMLALSVTMSFNVPALRHALDRIRAAAPDLPVLIGGHALEWEEDLATRHGVATCAPHPAALVEAAMRLTGIHPG